MMKTVTVFLVIAAMTIVVCAPAFAVPTTYYSEDFESYNTPVGMRDAAGPAWSNYDGAPTEFYITTATPLGTKAFDGKSMQVVSGGLTNRVEYFKFLDSVVPASGVHELSWDAFVEGYDIDQGTSQCDFGFMSPGYLPEVWWDYIGDGTGWQLRQWGITGAGITTIASAGMATDQPVHLSIAIDVTNKKLKGSLSRLSDGFMYYESSWIDYTGTAVGRALWMRQQYLVPGMTTSGMSIDNILITNGEVVPEPGSMMALGIGAIGLLGGLRRRLRK